ncbi:hypothetical protein SH584_11490 [Sphingomonas sp. LY29]|uniref:phage adaptor protein n=1 Tax=Sphingomonas sp. LY29 TaxID=3095341 RepID=UPI002D78916C|nr:hypothetical protein [Sphingomonas sp. LY29]WRP25655.1 hypothetical protein SH584_11490 [Sphingomonas sp. LY29]
MITTYDELVSAVGDWLDRDDLATRASTFVQFAEARMNRLLEDPEMEVVSTVIADGDYTALPADFGSMVSISTGDGPLSAVGAVEYAGLNEISGVPRHYVIVDGSIGFAPRNGTATIRMVYRRRIPALSDSNQTNWLLSLAPDAYLYGALVQAEGFLSEDDRISGWKDMFDEALSELRVDANKRKWGSGPIAPRIKRQ